jgi:hypothetical protein
VKHKDKEGTRKLVEREMHNALDSTNRDEVAYDSESDTEVHSSQHPAEIMTVRRHAVISQGPLGPVTCRSNSHKTLLLNFDTREGE